MEVLAIFVGCFGLGFMFSRRRRVGSWSLPTRDLLIGITFVAFGCPVRGVQRRGRALTVTVALPHVVGGDRRR
jgi:hypothetical protein